MFVQKPEDSIRYCLYCGKLNEYTFKDRHPLLLIEDCLDTLAGTKWLSIAGMENGYYQLLFNKKSQPKTAFIIIHGLHEHICLGFGQCNAPPHFSADNDAWFLRSCEVGFLAYLDDIIILGKDFNRL